MKYNHKETHVNVNPETEEDMTTKTGKYYVSVEVHNITKAFDSKDEAEKAAKEIKEKLSKL